MDYFYDLFDEISKNKSKSNHPENLTLKQFGKCIQTKHIIHNLNFFDINEVLNKFITNHNKEFDLYRVKYDCKLNFDKRFSPDIEYELEDYVTDFHL